MRTIPVEQSIRRLRDGNETLLSDALSASPRLQHRLGRRFSHRLQASDIEDVLNRALHRLWRTRFNFDRRRGTVEAWLFQIACSEAHNLFRTRRRSVLDRARSLDPALLDGIPDGRKEPPPVSSDPACFQEPVREALERLPAIQRRILLADCASPDGKVESRALARELNVTPSTVRVYRRRALRAMREFLLERSASEPKQGPSDEFRQ